MFPFTDCNVVRHISLLYLKYTYMDPPHGRCPSCSFSLESSSPIYLFGLFFHFLQVFPQMVTSHEAYLTSQLKIAVPLLHCWWECKLVQPLRRTVWRFLKKLKMELPYDPAIPLLGIYPDKTIIQKESVPQCSLQHYLQ